MAGLDEPRCHVGENLNVPCRVTKFITFNDLSDENKLLLEWRTGLKHFSPYSRICQGHFDSFIKCFAGNQKACCDPKSKHKARITKSLREVTIEAAELFKTKLKVNLIPGTKYCDACRKNLQKEVDHLEVAPAISESAHTNTPDDPNSQVSNFSNTDSQTCKDQIADIFDQLNLEHINFDGTRQKSKLPYITRKMDELTNVMCKKMKTAYHLKEDIDFSLSDLTKEKAANYDLIIERVKIVLETCNYGTKLQLLTLIPNLEQKKVQDDLGITRYTAASACKLKDQKGIFGVPDKKVGSRRFLDEEKQKVIDFYCDENSGNSKILPGKKDCVSIGKKTYKQKQLLLLNLRELYAAFKSEHPYCKPGFSTFCLLRPKWCVLAGSPGTHSICVCTIHQNVELQLHAVGSKFSLDDVISLLVCNSSNKDCMLRECPECPTNEEVHEILTNKFDRRSTIEEADNEEGDEDNSDEDYMIEFKQWVSTDRTELITRTVPKSEFFDSLSSAFQKLLPHAFTTVQQFKHINQLKKSLENDTCIVLLDFSENYNFITQDQAQAYYWTKNSSTVHPVVIYYKEEDKLVHQCLCFLSDDLNHDTSIVHIFQDRIVDFLKEKLSHIRRINYVSDGCVGQYKNCNNMLHLCEHNQKYGLSATWSFFATSHGKSPCDGIGGTIKREAANESLRRPFQNQILNVAKLLEFCKQRIEKIHCEIVWKKDVDVVREEEKNRANTIPGMRSFHEFVPLNERVIQCKKTSTDHEYSLKFDIINKKKIR